MLTPNLILGSVNCTSVAASPLLGPFDAKGHCRGLIMRERHVQLYAWLVLLLLRQARAACAISKLLGLQLDTQHSSIKASLALAC